MMTFKETVEAVGFAIDAVGVLIIVVGLAFAIVRFVANLHKPVDLYRQMRRDMGRGILLGLEFLVAADIIRTVAVEPTLQNVLVLGIIVLIRTVLSVALEVELENRWPWQQVPAARETTSSFKTGG